MKETCICSIKRFKEVGFIRFFKGSDYDLDAITFSTDPVKDKIIREGLLKRYFKKQINIPNIKETTKKGGKEK